MKVAELLERRRKHWQEHEKLCDAMANPVSAERKNPAVLARFAALYRAACADLALADSYQLPQNSVQYLHRLVGRAYNQLYRSRALNWRHWADVLLFDVPQKIFNDRAVQFAFLIFWGLFILGAYLGYDKARFPDFADRFLGRQQIETLEENFKNPIDGSQRSGEDNVKMAAFYIRHNTGIGLQCFAGGVAVVPGIMVVIFNGLVLGTSFGYMARPDIPEGENFYHFVTAHGPFELTAIVLSAGAGLRLGLSWIRTDGLSRGASLQRTGREAMPIMGAAIVMFFLAAMIEGFLSPSGAPYWIKAGVAVLSSCLLAFYFAVLGFPRR